MLNLILLQFRFHQFTPLEGIIIGFSISHIVGFYITHVKSLLNIIKPVIVSEHQQIRSTEVKFIWARDSCEMCFWSFQTFLFKTQRKKIPWLFFFRCEWRCRILVERGHISAIAFGKSNVHVFARLDRMSKGRLKGHIWTFCLAFDIFSSKMFFFCSFTIFSETYFSFSFFKFPLKLCEKIFFLTKS